MFNETKALFIRQYIYIYKFSKHVELQALLSLMTLRYVTIRYDCFRFVSFRFVSIRFVSFFVPLNFINLEYFSQR